MDADKVQTTVDYLTSLGWSEEDARRWLRGPARPSLTPPLNRDSQDLMPHSDALGRRERGRTGLPLAPRPQFGPGVRFRDVEHWCMALRNEDLPAELHAVYLRNLKAAIEAAGTPDVTVEDIAYWLHALRDPTLPGELRAAYKQSVRDALRSFDLGLEGDDGRR